MRSTYQCVCTAYALGFLDCKDISARCMLSIFMFFATKTDSSVLRMLNGSPADRLLKPITDYIEAKGGRIHVRTGCREVLYEDGSDGTPVVTGLRMTRAGKEEVREKKGLGCTCRFSLFFSCVFFPLSLSDTR